jgi:hypothetical protein
MRLLNSENVKKQIAGYTSDKETTPCSTLPRSEIWIAL